MTNVLVTENKNFIPVAPIEHDSNSTNLGQPAVTTTQPNTENNNNAQGQPKLNSDENNPTVVWPSVQVDDDIPPDKIPSIIEVVQMKHTNDLDQHNIAAKYINIIAASSLLPPSSTNIAEMSSVDFIKKVDGPEVRSISIVKPPNTQNDEDQQKILDLVDPQQANYHKGCFRAIVPCCFPPFCMPRVGRMPWIKYSELESQLRTGDIILFSGSGASCLVKCLLQTVWTHVALVVREPGSPDLLLFEATRKHNLPDVPTGKIGKGTMLVRLRDRLATYESQLFCVRQLRIKRDIHFYEKFHTFVAEMHGRPWEQDMLEFIKAGYDGPLGRNYHENLDSVFCSELTAAALKKLNILGGEAPSNEYAPNNFTESGYLPLINGASLGPQIRVIIDKELPKPMENKVRSLFRRMTEKKTSNSNFS